MPVLDSLAGVVDSLQVPGGIRVERASSTGPDARGNPRTGPLQRFTICPAIVQPARPRDLDRLPAGDRSSGAVLVHVKRKLRTAAEARGLGADVVTYRPAGDAEDLRYTVAMAADWAIIAGFFGVVCVKQERD